jgi:phospholipase D-like protein
MLAYEYGTLLVAAAAVLWLVLWVGVVIEVIRRRDLGIGGKVLWIVIVLVLPFIGLFIYALFRAARPAR